LSGLISHLSWALNTDEQTASRAADIASRWSAGEAEYAFARCESPAERLFLVGSQLNGEQSADLRSLPDDPCYPKETHIGNYDVYDLHSQVTIGRYRADFVIEIAHRQRNKCVDGNPLTRIVVEIDGHDFHSSKEQLSADHLRDIELLKMGIITIRFTGSQVYSDPSGCFASAIDAATAVECAHILADNESCNAYQAGVERGRADATDGVVVQ
jgi:very-short-patch-repair endonuclease